MGDGDNDRYPTLQDSMTSACSRPPPAAGGQDRRKLLARSARGREERKKQERREEQEHFAFGSSEIEAELVSHWPSCLLLGARCRSGEGRADPPVGVDCLCTAGQSSQRPQGVLALKRAPLPTKLSPHVHIEALFWGTC